MYVNYALSLEYAIKKNSCSVTKWQLISQLLMVTDTCSTKFSFIVDSLQGHTAQPPSTYC